jgi:drug/metabolite transporter (DMT)-like permease
MTLSLAWPMALIVASFVVYHWAMKSLRADLNPLLFLIPTYLVALSATALLWGTNRGMGPTAISAKDVALAAALGLALVGIEFGFIAAYRAGWSVNVAPTASNVMVAVLLVPLGWTLFRESFNWSQAAGLALCVAGLVLLTRR